MKLFEELKKKLVGRQEVTIDDNISEVLNNAPAKNLLEFIEQIRSKEATRKELLEEYNQMIGDSVIGSAVELLSDDSTQEGSKGKVVWVSSDDLEIKEYIDDFLEEIDLENNIWAYAYNLVKNGELFLKTYYTEMEQEEHEILESKKYKYFEIIDNPSTVSNLQKYGTTVGYSVQDEKGNTTIYPTMDYIHFVNDRGVNREKIDLKYIDNKGNEVKETFTIKYGTSYLETARKAYKILELIEDILISVRFGRSNLYRLFKIEVGSSSRVETSKKIREFKQKLTSTESMDMSQGRYTSTSKPIPHGGNIYVPTRNGTGDVNVDIVGGEGDIKDIVDIEYFRNKLFAALRIPKAFLGVEESIPGGLGNQSLTRLDIRYARMVKKIIQSLKLGVKDIIDYHLSTTGREDYIGNYKVEMSGILTADDTDVKEELSVDVNLADSIYRMFSDNENVDKSKLDNVIAGILKNIDGVEEIFKGENYGD